MTDYSSHRHKRPGSKVFENDRQMATDGGINDEAAQPDGDEAAASTPPKADDSGDDLDPGPPKTAREAPDDTEADEMDPSEAWKDHGYHERPKWAPECPSCGGPVIGFSVSGPMTSKITLCGCEVPPDMVDI